MIPIEQVNEDQRKGGFMTMQQSRKKQLLKAAVCVVLLVLALIGLRTQQYILTLLNFVCMYMISVSGLDILFGYSVLWATRHFTRPEPIRPLF